MSDPVSYTALVLAGTRPGGDPLAAYAGVSHKALIEVGGRAMLERVLLALDGARCVKRIVVAIDRPDVLAGFGPDRQGSNGDACRQRTFRQRCRRAGA